MRSPDPRPTHSASVSTVGGEAHEHAEEIYAGGSAAAVAALERLSASQLLEHVGQQFGRVAIACSFQKESSVILDLATAAAPGRFEIFTLDTGVLFQETAKTWQRFEDHFSVRIEGVRGSAPDRLWANDSARCCDLRKVVPLRERLAGVDVWVTGVRRDQSPARAATPKLGWDRRHGLWKVAPLADWSEQDVWSHILSAGVPYHSLHDRGYASIGCVPCTVPGEGRNGRWAGAERTECGLHG